MLRGVSFCEDVYTPAPGPMHGERLCSGQALHVCGSMLSLALAGFTAGAWAGHSACRMHIEGELMARPDCDTCHCLMVTPDIA